MNATRFNHPKGHVERTGTVVQLYVNAVENGPERLRSEKTCADERAADVAFWDAVEWLRNLRG